MSTQFFNSLIDSGFAEWYQAFMIEHDIHRAGDFQLYMQNQTRYINNLYLRSTEV